MRRLIHFIIFLIFGFSCIDPFDLSTGNQSNALVVDGLITDVNSESYVHLSRSLSFDNSRIQPIYFVPETNADVKVLDDLGDEVLFTETSPGIYSPANTFVGAPGRTYTLSIRTIDGATYQSNPEKMPAVPLIDSLIYEYHSYEQLVENSQGGYFVDTRYGFKLSVKVDDPEDERNYYRWKISGIYEFFSFIGETFFQCWVPVSRLEPSIRIKNDAYFNGNTLIEPLVVIPYDRPTYYMAMVKQMSLSPEAYNFLEEVRKQQANTGSIFDPIPSQIRGNIFNTENPNELVMGFFGASSVVEKSVLIKRFDASGFVSPSPNLLPEFGNCIDLIQGATNVKPPGFP